MAAMPTVKTLKRGTVVHTACVHCKAQLEYLPPPASSSPPDEPFTLECAQCGQTWINRPQKPRPQGKRRIGSGARTPLSLSLSLCADRNAPPLAPPHSTLAPVATDERPLETEYYDVRFSPVAMPERMLTLLEPSPQLLGLPITCTPEDVKKAYRRLVSMLE